MTDDSVSSSSWCYTAGIGYYSTVAMLHSLLDRVSKNGTMVLNIAPMADGTIPSGQQTILRGIGDYLGRFGESVYATRAWDGLRRGPDPDGRRLLHHAARAGTSQDIRFTRSKDNTVLYATVLGWPGNTLNITTLELEPDQPEHPDLGAAARLPPPVPTPTCPPGARTVGPAHHDALLRRRSAPWRTWSS